MEEDCMEEEVIIKETETGILDIFEALPKDALAGHMEPAAVEVDIRTDLLSLEVVKTLKILQNSKVVMEEVSMQEEAILDPYWFSGPPAMEESWFSAPAMEENFSGPPMEENSIKEAQEEEEDKTSASLQVEKPRRLKMRRIWNRTSWLRPTRR